MTAYLHKMDNGGFGRLLLRCQNGYTLVELLVVISILAVLTSVTAITFSTITIVGTRTASQNMVISQVQMAGDWISKDVVSSCNVTAGSPGSWQCSMQRYIWDGADNVTLQRVSYVIEDGILKRKVEDGAGVEVARFISGSGTDTTFVASSENNTYLLTVSSQFNEASFKRVYKIKCKSP